MRCIVAGTRTARLEDTKAAINACPWSDDVTVVVSGGARGADAHGELWAEARGLPVERFPANWREHGKAAGPIRNSEMAAKADALIAVWDGQSRGTADMIVKAERAGLTVFVWRIGNKQQSML